MSTRRLHRPRILILRQRRLNRHSLKTLPAKCLLKLLSGASLIMLLNGIRRRNISHAELNLDILFFPNYTAAKERRALRMAKIFLLTCCFAFFCFSLVNAAPPTAITPVTPTPSPAPQTPIGKAPTLTNTPQAPIYKAPPPPVQPGTTGKAPAEAPQAEQLPSILPVPAEEEEEEEEIAKRIPAPTSFVIETDQTYFISISPDRFLEVRQILPDVKLVKDDLVEVAQTDAKIVLSVKIQQAFYISKGAGKFIVEDTSLYMAAMNGLPGPLGKWFLQKMGNEGLLNIAQAFNNYRAEVITYVAYGKSATEIYYFEGRLKGEIVSMRGDLGVSWEPIFQPEGQKKTLAEMDTITKNAFSTRRLALEKLNDFLSIKDTPK